MGRSPSRKTIYTHRLWRYLYVYLIVLESWKYGPPTPRTFIIILMSIFVCLQAMISLLSEWNTVHFALAFTFPTLYSYEKCKYFHGNSDFYKRNSKFLNYKIEYLRSTAIFSGRHNVFLEHQVWKRHCLPINLILEMWCSLWSMFLCLRTVATSTEAIIR